MDSERRGGFTQENDYYLLNATNTRATSSYCPPRPPLYTERVGGYLTTSSEHLTHLQVRFIPSVHHSSFPGALGLVGEADPARLSIGRSVAEEELSEH